MLLGAAVLTALLADWVDAGVIIGVVMINAVIGFLQEGKAEKAVDAIRKILSYEALVLRNGDKVSVMVLSMCTRERHPNGDKPIDLGYWQGQIEAIAGKGQRTLAVAALDVGNKDTLAMEDVHSGMTLLNQFLSWRIVFISTIMVMGTLGLFLWDLYHDETLEMARTTAVNTLIFFQIFYLFNARYLKESVLSREKFLGNPKVLLAVSAITLLQLFFTYLPLFQNVFGTAAIPIGDWIRLIGFTFTVFILVEVEKMIMRHLDRIRTVE